MATPSAKIQPVLEPLSLSHQIVLVAMIIGPFIGTVFGIWHWPVHPIYLLTTVLFYICIVFGVTAGDHRLFTHQSYKADRRVKIVLAVLAEMSIQGPIIKWVAEHWFHHMFSDTENDLHSPMRSALHAHMMWFFKGKTADPKVCARHLINDPDILWLDRHFPHFVVLSLLVLPILVGALEGWFIGEGFLQGAWHGFIWCGLVRVFFVHHVTWSINSICHMWGKQLYKTPTNDASRNVWWLALFSMGESWHNLHHAFSKCALHGPVWWADPTYMLIATLGYFGLVTDVVRVPPETLERKRLPATA